MKWYIIEYCLRLTNSKWTLFSPKRFNTEKEAWMFINDVKKRFNDCDFRVTHTKIISINENNPYENTKNKNEDYCI